MEGKQVTVIHGEEHDDYEEYNNNMYKSEISPLLFVRKNFVAADGDEKIFSTQSSDIKVEVDVSGDEVAADSEDVVSVPAAGQGTGSNGNDNDTVTETENNNSLFAVTRSRSRCHLLLVLFVTIAIILLSTSSVGIGFSFHSRQNGGEDEDDDYESYYDVRISDQQILFSPVSLPIGEHGRSGGEKEEIEDATTMSNNENLFFPSNFIWGTATSSYQVEGAVHEGHRGVSIWDTFCKEDQDHEQQEFVIDDRDRDHRRRRHIVDGSNGDVACDHYHRFRDDVLLMKRLNIKAYRFSIAWTRIFPNGRKGEGKDSGSNPDGVAFYNELIDELLVHDIEPWVTLYHWDLPQALEDEYGGWLDPRIVDDFGEYAATCFDAFGDRVKHWITLNESWTVAVQAYEDGTKAPGLTDNPPVNVYRAGHHLLLAHARAVSMYRSSRIPSHKSDGRIGIANCGDFRYPKNPQSLDDQDAAERAMVFQFGWLTDPLVFGDYPQEMKDRVGDRLPKFTLEQKEELVGTLDFVGLNHYSTLYAAAKKQPEEDDEENRPVVYGGYWNDMAVDFATDPSWRKNYMGWSTNPDGCRELLLWISKRYPGLEIAMTENGTSEDEPNVDIAIDDDGRRRYFESYLRACGEAIQLGVPLHAYFAWSLMDNFEWEYGYTRRFGICYVDFHTLERTPKSSALWYRDTIELNGSNLKMTSI